MLGWEGELPEPSVRTIREMRSVLAEPECACELPLYFMYRDLARSDADWQWLHAHHLRYDLTVIPPHDLCGECVKTKGHYHPSNAHGVGYPEIYEVLEGTVHYLVQSRTLDDVVRIAAEAGDIVIVPPGYGHVSINPSPDSTLSMANIVSTAFESDYGEYETLHGAAYYEMTTGELIKNPHYQKVPPIRELDAASGRGKHRFCKGPIYSLIGNEDALAFLNHPEKFVGILSVLLKG
ncbi:MAG: glucose-6-phosphate isomerase [Methanoregula sp.]|nr:MAG: glucose-6-phosphate isomerase [Methanoregula sp.]